MTTLYLTRHGQTMWNVEGKMQGWLDSPLTKLGIEHAELLGKRLQNIEFDAVYSSTSKRAFDTAEIIKGQRKLSVIPDDSLRELNMGNWEGRLVEELRVSCAERFGTYWNTPHLYVPDGGEDFETAEKRVVSKVLEIVGKHKDKNVLVVSHGISVLLILMHFKKMSLEKLWDQPFIQGTSLSIVRFEEGDAQILMHGDMSHVEGFEE